MRYPAFKLSCVIPAYNESAHLKSFVEQLFKTLSLLTQEIEIIIVNDGSNDDTEQVIKTLLPHYPIHYMALSRNFGKEAALSAGIDASTGDVTLLIDGDFQHPLTLIPEMVTLWQSGYDMVYGVITDRSNEPKLKQIGTNFLYKLLNHGHTKFDIPLNAGDFRLMDRVVVDALRQLPERNRFMKGLYAWVGFKTVALPFTPAHRASGQSSFNLTSLFRLAVTGITSFTTLPLKISGIVGLLISFLSMLYGIYIGIDTLMSGNKVPGWTTLAIGLMFFSGIQLMLIGILGEYIGQVYEEVKNRPVYIVSKSEQSSIAPQTTSPDLLHDIN